MGYTTDTDEFVVLIPKSEGLTNTVVVVLLLVLVVLVLVVLVVLVLVLMSSNTIFLTELSMYGTVFQTLLSRLL